MGVVLRPLCDSRVDCERCHGVLGIVYRCGRFRRGDNGSPSPGMHLTFSLPMPRP